MLSGYVRRRLMPTRSIMRIVIVAVVIVTGLLHAFVPALVRNTAPMAAAGGMLSMLGAQAAHADEIDEALSSWPQWSSQACATIHAYDCHGRRRKHALHAGRAGGSCRQDR